MELARTPSVYSSANVEKEIRDFFRAERKRLDLNQAEVATSGGVEQSTISKIERDAPYEPSVAIFLRAIHGLGMTPAAFFAKFEHERRAMLGGLQNQVLKPTVVKSDNATSSSLLIPKVASHGLTHVPAAATETAFSEEDVRAFLRVLKESLGGSFIEAFRRGQKKPRQPRKQTPSHRARRATGRKTS